MSKDTPGRSLVSFVERNKAQARALNRAITKWHSFLIKVTIRWYTLKMLHASTQSRQKLCASHLLSAGLHFDNSPSLFSKLFVIFKSG